MSELREVSPRELSVSDMNERRAWDSTSDIESIKQLEESVDRVGVLEPIIVRERDDVESLDAVKVKYEVVIGQRRMIAAQNVGCESVPIVVVEWDDAEALERSIVENIDAFQEQVGKKDRAVAVYHLKEMNEWTKGDLSEHLNVSKQTVRRWLEYANDWWKGTKLHIETDSNNPTCTGGIDSGGDLVRKTSMNTVAIVRRATSGNEDGLFALKIISELGLSERDVRCIKQRADGDKEFFINTLRDVVTEAYQQQHGDEESVADTLDLKTELPEDIEFGAVNTETITRVMDKREDDETELEESDPTDETAETGDDGTEEVTDDHDNTHTHTHERDHDDSTSVTGAETTPSETSETDVDSSEPSSDDAQDVVKTSGDDDETATSSDSSPATSDTQVHSESNDSFEATESIRFSMIGEDAHAVSNAIEEEDMTAKQLGREAVQEYLERGNYYE